MLFECRSCEAIVDGVQLSHYDTYDSINAETQRYSFGKCPRCSSPFLVREDERYDTAGEPGWVPTRLYPPEDDFYSHPYLPYAVALAYVEAKRCFKGRAYTAAAIMCGKVLEATVSEYGYKQQTLANALKSMKDDGIIENNLFQWAEALRLFRNEAAHSVESRLSKEDTQDLLDFTFAFTEYVFTYRIRFEAFMARRKRKQAIKQVRNSNTC